MPARTTGPQDQVEANVLGGGLALPALVLKEGALANNLKVMAAYTQGHGLELAPHAKTTMAPKLLRRQLEAGAWGLTVANVAQARVAWAVGAPRVLVANEVVGAADIAWLAGAITKPGPQVLCLVDSVPGVELLDHHLGRALGPGAPARLSVLVELGALGGRSGARGVPCALGVAHAVAQTSYLRLAGVEGYEGVIGADRSPEVIAAVDSYLRQLGELAVELGRAGAFDGFGPVIVSAGGSRYFDRVAQVLTPGGGGAVDYEGLDVSVVARSGCYLTHDHGVYAQTSPLSTAQAGQGQLEAALEVWAEVLSRPEPGLAIVGMGKRDVSFDLGLPVALRAVSAGGERTDLPAQAVIVALDDQHGYLRWPPEGQQATLEVGDRIGFGLSHPCTAFDKWAVALLVDEGYNVIDRIETCFR